MSLNHTVKEMKQLLAEITSDLDKAENGNKAASQRVRTGTVKLEKVAKAYRKESIQSEKQPRTTKKSSTAKKHTTTHSKTHHTTTAKKTSTTKASTSAKVKAKPKAAVAKARPRALSVKRPTAKLPTRSLSFR